ncbi:MAG: cell envelope integrity protein CreD [Rhodocyclaceae bacterium]
MRTLLGKALTLLLLIVALTVGVGSVRSIIYDRLSYREQAVEAVTSGLPRDLTVAGVALVVPYVDRFTHTTYVEEKGKMVVRTERREKKREHVVRPDALQVVGNLTPDPRRLGLFEVMAYQFDGHLKGRLSLPKQSELSTGGSDSQLTVGRPRLVLTLSDTRGLRQVGVVLDGAQAEAQPGTGSGGTMSGVHVELTEAQASQTHIEFDMTLVAGGSGAFRVIPIGKHNVMEMRSPWAHPSFLGDALPVERDVSAQGFTAAWRADAMATDAGPRWQQKAFDLDARGHFLTQLDGAFSVQLIQPVDIYALAHRATKYAFMFIILTLGSFMAYELVRNMRVHAIQYLLVGAAQFMFFLLLLALSEHIGFALAYVVATAACVVLIGYYIAAVLGSLRRGAAFAGLLTLLYGALYGILQSEQNALLLGASLVFVVLAVVMIGTRRINWFALTERTPAAARPKAPPASPN